MERGKTHAVINLFDVHMELEFRSVGFCVEEGKPVNPKKNPPSKSRTRNNKLNSHETASSGIEPGSQVVAPIHCAICTHHGLNES